MSEEQLKAFLEKIKGDTSLQEKLKAAADSDAVLAIAKEAGFSIFADDLNKAQSEIEDAELEASAGGQGCVTHRGDMSFTNACAGRPGERPFTANYHPIAGCNP